MIPPKWITSLSSVSLLLSLKKRRPKPADHPNKIKMYIHSNILSPIPRWLKQPPCKQCQSHSHANTQNRHGWTDTLQGEDWTCCAGLRYERTFPYETPFIYPIERGCQGEPLVHVEDEYLIPLTSIIYHTLERIAIGKITKITGEYLCNFLAFFPWQNVRGVV